LNAAELIKFLKKNGCRIENNRGGTGHRTAYRGNRKTTIPIHGKSRELPKGLIAKIKKDLEIR
jgi:mRNA interferase HicA